MSRAPSLMLADLAEASDAAARHIGERDAARVGRLLAAVKPSFVLLCGRGSSGHVATFLRHLIETRLGVPTGFAMPSTTTIYRAGLRCEGAVWIAVSQSGRSPDLVGATEAARAAGAVTVALVNDAASPLALAADHVVAIEAGPERSIAATKTVLASLAAGVAMVARWSGDRDLERTIEVLPALLRPDACPPWEGQVVAAHRNAACGIVLGRGLGRWLAAEAALKLAEVAGLAALDYGTAEFRHGPRTLLAAGLPVLGFVQNDAASAGIREELAEAARQGAAIFAADASAERFVGEGAAPMLVGVPSTGDPVAASIAMAVPFYRFAESLAWARGRDPDAPPLLTKITRTL